ncbi:MAG: division/cell wall cluster transcriptional repressor MraZ [bacterium]
MFYGETSINLDTKGRVAVPTRYREQIEGDFARRLVVTYNPYESHCLYMYPEQRWEEVRDGVMSLKTADEQHRWMKRSLVGSAALIEPDAQWRVQLPLQLRQETALEKRVVLMGVGDKFEIWNEAVLRESRRKFMEQQKLRASASVRDPLQVSADLQSLDI